MVAAGMDVKIPDIGSQVKCLEVVGMKALLEVCGERFWFPADLIEELFTEEQEG